MSDKFVICAPASGFGGYWGKGETLEEAKAALKAAGGKLTRYVAFELPDGAEDVAVNWRGDVEWRWAEGADRDGRAKVVAKRGVGQGIQLG